MTKVIATALPNIPWQDAPEGCQLPIWRYSENPVIGRFAIPSSNSIFNSAVVPFKDGFAGVFRCDSRSRSMDIFAGFSDDGLNWEIEPEPIDFQCDIPDICEKEYRYDPRVVNIDGRYYITWCNGYHGPTIGVGYTDDFKTFHQLENAFLPYNRNGVMFPEKINGNFAMVSRPSDTGHTAFGDIFYSESPDLEFWGRHRHVFGTVTGNESAWQSTKVGAGPIPIKTEDGWLMIYHGVLTSCNGYVYAIGAALLDLEEPWKLIYRSKDYLMSPLELYELAGDVPNVVFPCAALVDGETGRLAMYYGAADSVTGLAFATVDGILDWLKEHALEE